MSGETKCYACHQLAPNHTADCAAVAIDRPVTAPEPAPDHEAAPASLEAQSLYELNHPRKHDMVGMTRAAFDELTAEVVELRRALASRPREAGPTSAYDLARDAERRWNMAVDAERREPDDFDYSISDETDPPSDPLFRRIVARALTPPARDGEARDTCSRCGGKTNPGGDYCPRCDGLDLISEPAPPARERAEAVAWKVIDDRFTQGGILTQEREMVEGLARDPRSLILPLYSAAPMAQKCPVCDGHAYLSYPKGVAPGQSFTDSSTGNYPCHACEGRGLLYPHPAPPRAEGTDVREDVAVSGFCVACGQSASEHNTFGDTEGNHVLNVYPKYSLCDSCVPGNFVLTDDMEPEEVALRCWHADITLREIPVEEVAERLMRWTELRSAAPSVSAGEVTEVQDEALDEAASEFAVEWCAARGHVGGIDGMHCERCYREARHIMDLGARAALTTGRTA